jgi:molybdopterin/thiamine biosynthesis adenylyltransferase
MLSDAQIERYSRQLILPEIGPAGQERLLAGSVALAGDPGANAAALLYLAGAGVGRLTVLHGGPGERETSGATWGSLPEPSNPDSSLVRLHVRHQEVATTLAEHDAVILSGGDDPLRTAVNRACVARAIPLVFGAAAGAQGFLVTFAGHRSDAPCYDCVAATLPTPTTEDPALGAVSGNFLATLQATEAIKLVLGIGEIAGGQMVVWDLRSDTFSPRAVEKNPTCPTCAGTRPRS